MSNNTEFADKVGSYSSSEDHSIVWNYFDKLPLGQDGVKKASCIGCGKVFQANKEKLNMKRHLPECFIIDEPGPPKKRAHLDQAMYREKLAYSIIKHNYPFSYVEHEATRDLFKFLNPGVTPITRNTAEADVLKIYDREKTNLKEKLQKYWKENQGRYPQLSLMARDILSIPMITIASKSSFSIGGRVLSKYRSSLPSSNVEALLCTRDWLFDLEDENENDIEERLAEDIESLYSSYDGSPFSIPKENKK
ncbi:putative transcription factor/ chromatin remodeling BED-type(Zn) family [Helianthus debilis subsp. tardiflorus]